jgi:hypothetical protein
MTGLPTECDLTNDAPKYVLLALQKVRDDKGKDATIDLDALASNYVAPKPSNITELKREYARSTGLFAGESVDDHEFKSDLIQHAIQDINMSHDDMPIFADIDDTEFRLHDDVDIYELKIGLEPILPKPLPDLFGPEGLWRENIRVINFDPDNDKDDRELLDLMRENGWMKQFPAEVDEHGVWLTGHRRKAAADILGIKYVTNQETYGDDEAGKAKRAQVALGSNIGVKKFTPQDRKRIVFDLYTSGNGKWVTTSIAKLLNVSAMTVSRDLSGFNSVKPPKERGGRPRKEKADPKPTPTPETTIVVPMASGIADAIADVMVAQMDAAEVAKAETDVADESALDADVPQDLGLWLVDIAAKLSLWADHLECSETEYREQMRNEYADALLSVEEQFDRVTVALDLAEESQAVVPTANDDANVERVAKGIVRWLNKHERGTRGAIRKNLEGPNRKRGTLGDRRFCDAALEQLVQAGVVVVADDGEIERGAGEPQ